MKKDTATLQSEMEYIREYTEKFYCSPATHDEVSALVSEIIADRRREYLYQRLRDWQSDDLLNLAHTFRCAVVYHNTQESEVKEKRRGRPKRD